MISKSKKAFFVWKKSPTPFRITVRPFYAVQEQEREKQNDDVKSRTSREELFLVARTERPSRELSSRIVAAAREYRSHVQKQNELRDQAGRAFMQSSNRKRRGFTERRNDKVGESKRWQYMQVKEIRAEPKLAHNGLSRVAVSHRVRSVVLLVSAGGACAVGTVHGVVPAVTIPGRLVVCGGLVV